ncbi:MAG TPA: hypothetical protein VM865_08970 [Acidobacteriaceae bacterium]|nr:hypothetical protein [Acidobacteriaceae bacterium]
MASGYDSTKTGARPSHEAIETTGGKATQVADTPLEHADHEAMESAKRAQNRIKNNEGQNPGTQPFTK